MRASGEIIVRASGENIVCASGENIVCARGWAGQRDLYIFRFENRRINLVIRLVLIVCLDSVNAIRLAGEGGFMIN